MDRSAKGPNGPGIRRIGIEGDGEMPIPELEQACHWRSWAIADGGIYFVAYSPNSPYELNFYDLTTRQIKAITQAEKIPLPFVASLGVAADGRSILYAQSDQSASSIKLAKF